MARKRSLASAGKSQTSESQDPAPAQTAIVFDGSLDIAGAEQLRDRLMQALSRNQPIVLDAANVERVDTSALQVLTAFFKDAGAYTLQVQWKEPAQT